MSTRTAALLTADRVAPRSTRAYALRSSPCISTAASSTSTRSLELAARAGASRVVEDSAQAHGARYRGRRIGSLGRRRRASSFYPAKNLGAGATRAPWSRTTAARRTGSASCAPTASARATTTRWLARPPAWTRSRPRCCPSKLRAPRRRRTSAPASLAACAHGRAGRRAASASPPPAEDWAEQVFHQYVIRQPRIAMRCGEHLGEPGIETAVALPGAAPSGAGLRGPRLPRRGSAPIAEALARTSLLARRRTPG